MANSLSMLDNIIILCGHYKGIDYRIREHLITKEISIGDYVLTGGELPAAIITDAIVRLISATSRAHCRTPSKTTSWSPRFIRARQNIMAGACRRYFCRATRPKSMSGATSSRSNARRACVLTF